MLLRTRNVLPVIDVSGTAAAPPMTASTARAIGRARIVASEVVGGPMWNELRVTSPVRFAA